VGTHAEVLDGLTAVLGTTEQQGVATSGGTQSELIEGKSLTTGSENAGTGGGGESQSSDAQLGDREETVVVGDGTDNNDGLTGLASLTSLGLAYNARQGDGRSVGTGHKKAAENDLVEGRVGSACQRYRLASCRASLHLHILGKGFEIGRLTGQEAVKLHQELEVDIVTLGRLAVSVAHVMLVQIDTLKANR
jgi:hypothetical protein